MSYYDPPETRTEQPRTRNRSPQRITGVQVVFLAILAIGMLLTINFSARITRGQAYDDLKANVEGTITVLREENIDLEQELIYVQSDAAVEEWAHRDAKMVRPGEILVIPVPGLILPTATPAPVVTSIEDTNALEPDVPTVDLWWSLFFDTEPPW